MRRFPEILGDGTFRVRLQFEAPPKNMHLLQTWLSDWPQTHDEQTHFGFHFSDSFQSAPRAICADSGELWILLSGSPPDIHHHWRDWYVQLVREVLQAFPELGRLSKVEDGG
jgi:hypothetical protein